MTRAWYEIDWRTILLIGAVLLGVTALNHLFFYLNSPAEVACVLVRDGEPVKARGDACNVPGVEGIKLRLESSDETQQKTPQT
ncbi:MAG TPA: hypothetical protein V6D18_17440 [Thermosynechococcaceae cyanobacterium]